MRRFQGVSIRAALALAACLGPLPAASAADKKENEKDYPNSYKYYGPGGLWKQWTGSSEKAQKQRLGRDTWIHWTWGNQKVIRQATVLAGSLPVPVSLDLFRLLDSRKRGTRFRDLGLINEPNCGRKNKKDPNEPDYDEDIHKKYGLYIDKWNGDPEHYYPGDPMYVSTYPNSKEAVDTRHYGWPSGIVGLRLFKNPAFEKVKDKWNVRDYFRNPGKVEPPFLVGFTCGFCHVAFNPLNPPSDPENPHWMNLAANIGNQYIREGELMLGKGRVLFGDKNPLPGFNDDPYQTQGLTEMDFLYHYAVTQQPGTSETSRISYDFINNPNTINPIFGLVYRPTFTETTPWGKKKEVMHILKDGADSISIEWALMRVPINIGCEGNYWIDHLFLPGRDQRPFRIPEVLAGLHDDDQWKQIQASLGLPTDAGTARRLRKRLAELRVRYPASPYGKEEFGQDWQEAWRRVNSVGTYLMSYEPARLRDAVSASNPADARAARDALPSTAQPHPGAAIFGKHCARCHSSRKPDDNFTPKQKEEFFIWSARAPKFIDGNFLSDDVRYAVTEKGLRTNMARALATNAVDHDVWSNFSSREYKALPSIAPVTPLFFQVPVFPVDPARPAAAPAPIRIEFDPPAGGRGYYRTPSLISVWATAPYLHNNSVGNYRVIKEDGKKDWFPNDGSRIGRVKDGKWVDYQIDYSVDGRVKMFESGMKMLLNPSRRHRWVKRTSTPSGLIPDPVVSVQQLLASVARDSLQYELRKWLKENQVLPSEIEATIQILAPALDRTLQSVFPDVEASARVGWSVAMLRARDQADRFFDLAYNEVKQALEKKVRRRLPLDRAKLALRSEFLGRLDQLDKQVRAASLLTVPAGTPVNLYANLGPGKLAAALLAHIRYKDDRRALAQALLEMSACPDFVEDRGHTYGVDLTDKEKADLIDFLKTF